MSEKKIKFLNLKKSNQALHEKMFMLTDLCWPGNYLRFPGGYEVEETRKMSS